MELQTSKVDMHKMPMRHSNMTCGDCEHFNGLGCWEAAEALALEGYPRAAVLVRDYMSAEGCPSFVRSDESRDGGAVKSWGPENRVDEMYAIKAGK